MSMESNDQKKIGLRIRSVRVLTGLNQQEFAEISGFNHTSLRNWEFGRVLPRKDAINKLIEAFRKFFIYVDIEWIVFGRGSGPILSDSNYINSLSSEDKWENEIVSFKDTCKSSGLTSIVIKIVDDDLAPQYCSGDIVCAVYYKFSDLLVSSKINHVLNKPSLVKINNYSYLLRFILYDGCYWWEKDNKTNRINKINHDGVGIISMHISNI